MKTLEKRMISYLFLLLIINYTVSCSYYKVIVSPASEVSKFPTPEIINSRFIVHQNDNLYIFKIKSLDQKSIKGILEIVDNKSVLYNKDNKSNEYNRDPKSNGKSIILNEVHIYLNDEVMTLQLGQIEILLDQIKEIRFIEKDIRKTRKSTLWWLAGATTVGLVILYVYAITHITYDIEVW